MEQGQRYNQIQFTAMVANASGVDLPETQRVLRAVFDVVGEVVTNQGSIVIPNFGTWRSIGTGPQMRRNPQTGDVFPVPASRRPSFRFAKALRTAVSRGEAPATFKKRGNGRASKV
jgi:nucleoid DNA-binding protein